MGVHLIPYGIRTCNATLVIKIITLFLRITRTGRKIRLTGHKIGPSWYIVLSDWLETPNKRKCPSVSIGNRCHLWTANGALCGSVGAVCKGIPHFKANNNYDRIWAIVCIGRACLVVLSIVTIGNCYKLLHKRIVWSIE